MTFTILYSLAWLVTEDRQDPVNFISILNQWEAWYVITENCGTVIGWPTVKPVLLKVRLRKNLKVQLVSVVVLCKKLKKLYCRAKHSVAMASLVRAGFGKLSGKLLVTSTNFQVIRTITSKLDDLPPKPKPWNYNEKSYTLLNYFFDKTTDRFDENTKVRFCNKIQ